MWARSANFAMRAGRSSRVRGVVRVSSIVVTPLSTSVSTTGSYSCASGARSTAITGEVPIMVSIKFTFLKYVWDVEAGRQGGFQCAAKQVSQLYLAVLWHSVCGYGQAHCSNG